MSKNRIGEELRKLRIEHGFRTIKEFTEAAAIPYMTYYPLEKGSKHPQRNTVIKLAEFYEIPADELIEKIEALKKIDGAEQPILELPVSFAECSIEQLQILFGNVQAVVSLIELYQAELKHSKKTNISANVYRERLEALLDKLLEP